MAIRRGGVLERAPQGVAGRRRSHAARAQLSAWRADPLGPQTADAGPVGLAAGQRHATTYQTQFVPFQRAHPEAARNGESGVGAGTIAMDESNRPRVRYRPEAPVKPRRSSLYKGGHRKGESKPADLQTARYERINELLDRLEKDPTDLSLIHGLDEEPVDN